MKRRYLLGALALQLVVCACGNSSNLINNKVSDSSNTADMATTDSAGPINDTAATDDSKTGTDVTLNADTLAADGLGQTDLSAVSDLNAADQSGSLDGGGADATSPTDAADSTLSPETTDSAGQNCRTYYTSVFVMNTTFTWSFDKQTKTLTNVTAEATTTRYYESVADFVNEGKLLGLSLATKVVEVRPDDTRTTLFTFDGQGRLTGWSETSTSVSYAPRKRTYSQWDNAGRPTVGTYAMEGNCDGQVNNDSPSVVSWTYDDANLKITDARSASVPNGKCDERIRIWLHQGDNNLIGAIEDGTTIKGTVTGTETVCE